MTVVATIRGLCLPLALCALVASGCSSAVAVGESTALDGDDMVRMTEDMAAKIAASHDVRAAVAGEQKLIIVVEPVVNDMRAESLSRGAADAFTGRVRCLLDKHAPDTFVWVINRDTWHRLRGHAMDVDLGPSPDTVKPRYALTARFQTLTHEDRKHRISTYLCVYQLTDLRDRQVLWTDKYELTKAIQRGLLD